MRARKADEMNLERSVLSLSPPGQSSNQRRVSDGSSTAYRCSTKADTYQFSGSLLLEGEETNLSNPSQRAAEPFILLAENDPERSTEDHVVDYKPESGVKVDVS